MITTFVPMGTHYWLLYPPDATFNVWLSQVNVDSFSEVYEEAELLLIGRGRKKDYGTRWGYSGSITAQVWDRSDLTARQIRQALESLRAKLADVYLRNPFGDVWHIALQDMTVGRMAGIGQREFFNLTLPYNEVSN